MSKYFGTNLKETNKFIDEFGSMIQYVRYNNTSKRADSPYLSGRKNYLPPVDIKALVVVNRQYWKENVSKIGEESRRIIIVMLSQSQVIQYLIPEAEDDPRLLNDIDFSDKIRMQDKFIYQGIEYKIDTIRPNADDGSGAILFEFQCRSEIGNK